MEKDLFITISEDIRHRAPFPSRGWENMILVDAVLLLAEVFNEVAQGVKVIARAHEEILNPIKVAVSEFKEPQPGSNPEERKP